MNKTMLTDLYQLTMGAGYAHNKVDGKATFELFIRNLPQDWGYFLANGVEDAIDYITSIKFTDEDLSYLSEQGLPKNYVNSLKDFKFNGEVFAVKEGTPVFPNQPIIRVTGTRTESQFVESALLNIINHQTLIASKASRIVTAANGRPVIDFGLRRAQGYDASMLGARAAYIAGAVGTSNVLAAKEYHIPISGTMAHSFVMSFDSEIESFRAYVNTFPDNATLLIDTYDTIQGAKNAGIVAKELEAKGHKLKAVRIDSGDIYGMSKITRQVLDSEGANYVKIIATNDLNEYKIDDLLSGKAPLDGFGVGTEMITAKPIAAISGVYKLVQDDSGAKIKLSAGKQTLPGVKQIYRIYENGKFSNDIIALEGENVQGKALLERVVVNGSRVRSKPALNEIRSYSLSQVALLPDYLIHTKVAETYPVNNSQGLESTIADLIGRKKQVA